jgi:hypothetical protein
MGEGEVACECSLARERSHEGEKCEGRERSGEGEEMG